MIGIALYVLNGIMFTLFINEDLILDGIGELDMFDKLITIIGYPIILGMIIYWWCEDIYAFRNRH